MDATSGWAAVWWGAGIAVLLLVVIPLVLVLSMRLLKVLFEVRRYSDDILTHGLGIASALESVPALVETRDLVSTIRPKLEGHARTLESLL